VAIDSEGISRSISQNLSKLWGVKPICRKILGTLAI
jgi:hypothetical protein